MKTEDATAAGFTDADKYQPRQGDDGVAGGTGFLHYSADGKYVTVASGKGDAAKDILVEVFRDGALLKDWTMEEIRKKSRYTKRSVEPVAVDPLAQIHSILSRKES